MGPSHVIFALSGWIAHAAHGDMSAEGIGLALLVAGIGVWSAARDI